MPLGAHGLRDHPPLANSGSFIEVERSEISGQTTTDCFARTLLRQRQSILAVNDVIPFLYSRFVPTV